MRFDKIKRLMEARKRTVIEMSVARDVHTSYWHGTTGEAGRRIARDGRLLPFDVVDPERTRSRSGLMPQKGKVYLGDFHVGLSNAIYRGNMKDGKGEGAIVEVDASTMGVYAPDEDEVADIISSYVLDHRMPLYHSGVADDPTVMAFRARHRAHYVTRDRLREIPRDVADALTAAFPIKKPAEYALGAQIVRRYIDGVAGLRPRWEKAQRDGDYEHFTWLGKKVLAQIKADDGIMDKIVALSTRVAHDGEVPVKRVLVFKTDDLPQYFDKEKFSKLTIGDIEKIAEVL